MSKWEDLKKSIESFADKTARKTRELTDAATLKIKIAGKESDRDAEYKNLGKLMYVKLKGDAQNSDELTALVSESLERLDLIISELNALKNEESAKKAEKAAKTNAENGESQEGGDDDEPALNTAVMDQFNEARKTADQAYEEAKAAADDAK